MPNTFGSIGGGFPLVDPRCVREHRERFRRDAFPELDRANSFYATSGQWPGTGWIMLDREGYNGIDKYAANLQLKIEDFANPGITISNLSIVQARCVTTGLPSDPAAIYLIQLTDVLGILYNPWFQFPIDAQYNVRAPSYDGQYYSYSTNSGTPWTWDTMVGDIWSKTPILGTYPHLPVTPTGTPENFVFAGESLWEALSQIMDYLGLSITGEYPSFGIAVAGAADASYSALLTQYADQLEDSMEYIDVGSGRVPGSVKVFFHTRYQFYGQEETVRMDSQQWEGKSVYSVTVNAPGSFISAAGTGYVWSDFTVRLDMDGNPLPADITTAAAIAAERVTQFFQTIHRGTEGFSRLVYGGIIPFTTGSLVDGVRWYNTGMRCEGVTDDYAGWHTEIIRGYMWPEVTFPITVMGLTGPTF